MKFTVIIPIYNGEQTIVRSLASLISNADYIDEVIIVDDHSSDGFLKKVKPFKKFLPIKVIESDGYRNPGCARRTGIEQAKSEWITFLDSDDCLTASSLRYVSDRIEKYENENTVLLHTQTIYYESGIFTPDNISHSDGSCGGNFYKKSYLMENGLLPHKALPMCEDEYFNWIIDAHIIFHGEKDDCVLYYDYPVYEVHHDILDRKSYALSNWTDYCIKYHLLYAELAVRRFMFDNRRDMDYLEDFYINQMIFIFLMAECLIQDPDINFDISEYKREFSRAFDFYEGFFGKPRKNIADVFYGDELTVISQQAAAELSTGVTLEDDVIEFNDFINDL